jgi:hypothetical protein
MKTDWVFGPNENTGVADRRMAGHPVLLPDWNAVSTKRFPWKSRIPIRSRQAREEKPHTYTHKRTKPKKLHKKLNFAKWQQSKRDTKRCMLRRTTKLTSDVETFCQPLQWPRVPLSQVPCLCAYYSTICFATDLSGLGKLANPLLSRRASFAIKKGFGIRFERALIA